MLSPKNVKDIVLSKVTKTDFTRWYLVMEAGLSWSAILLKIPVKIS